MLLLATTTLTPAVQVAIVLATHQTVSVISNVMNAVTVVMILVMLVQKVGAMCTKLLCMFHLSIHMHA